MKKVFLSTLLSIGFVGFSFAITPSTTPPINLDTLGPLRIDVQCLKNAITTREQRIQTAYSTYATKYQQALTARKTTIDNALTQTARTGVKAVMQSGSKIFRETTRRILNEFRLERKAARDNYFRSMAECAGSLNINNKFRAFDNWTDNL